MMGLGLLIPVLLIGAVAYAAGWRPQFPSSGQGQAPGGPAKDDPLDIVRERYARGEISSEEYRRTQEDLRS
jgi:uncharacterized membrane protein